MGHGEHPAGRRVLARAQGQVAGEMRLWPGDGREGEQPAEQTYKVGLRLGDGRPF
jgi:hypothetical protein